MLKNIIAPEISWGYEAKIHIYWREEKIVEIYKSVYVYINICEYIYLVYMCKYAIIWGQQKGVCQLNWIVLKEYCSKRLFKFFKDYI